MRIMKTLKSVTIQTSCFNQKRLDLVFDETDDTFAVHEFENWKNSEFVRVNRCASWASDFSLVNDHFNEEVATARTFFELNNL